MSRALWKGVFTAPQLFRPAFLNSPRKEIWARNSVIPEHLCGTQVFIHNGLEFVKCKVTREKVGFKFGYFAKTRRLPVKKKKKKIFAKKGKKK